MKMRYEHEIDVLGTHYHVSVLPEGECTLLKECDGYCDKTTKEIVVSSCPDSNLGHPLAYIQKNLRHEIVHAFMFESGLGENIMHQDFGQEEQMIDWVAWQFWKMANVIKEAEAIADKEWTEATLREKEEPK